MGWLSAPLGPQPCAFAVNNQFDGYSSLQHLAGAQRPLTQFPAQTTHQGGSGFLWDTGSQKLTDICPELSMPPRGVGGRVKRA